MSTRGGFNNILAGVFILLFLAGGVTVVLILAGFREGLASRHAYIVRFNLADGAEGLDVGSLVKVGGQKVGKVTNLQFYQRDGSDLYEAIDVTIAIDKGVRLYKNARVYLQLPLLGSQSQINIPFAGDPRLLALKDGDTGVVEPGNLLDGKLAPPAFLSQAGYGEEQADQLRLMFKRGAEISDKLASIVRKTDNELDRAMPALSQSLVDIRAMIADFKAASTKWLPIVESSLNNIHDATGETAAGIKDFREIIQQFQVTVRSAMPKVESILHNIDELTGKANTQLYDKLAATVDSTRRAVDEFARIGVKTSGLIDELTPELRLTFGNLRLASDQMKLALTEIRRNPWKVLYQPTRKELSEELLMDSARTYASAVSNLQAASASLEQALAAARAQGQKVDPQILEAITARIKAADEEYRKAEKMFLDRFMVVNPEVEPKK